VRAVNLLPVEQRKPRQLGTVAQLAVVSPLVVAAAVAGGTLIARSKVADQRITLKALQAELAALPKPKTPSPANAQLAAEREQRMRALAGALGGRVAWDRVLREISSVLPEDIWLTTLQAQSVPAPAPTPAPSSTDSTSTDPETTTTTTMTTTTETTTTTPAPAPAAIDRSLVLDGYTYSQEGVARFMSRLQVIPELTNVALERSDLTKLGDRDVVQFTIDADVRTESQ